METNLVIVKAPSGKLHIGVKANKSDGYRAFCQPMLYLEGDVYNLPVAEEVSPNCGMCKIRSEKNGGPV